MIMMWQVGHHRILGCIDYRHRERLAGFTGPVVVRLDEMAIERERDSGAFGISCFDTKFTGKVFISTPRTPEFTA